MKKYVFLIFMTYLKSIEIDGGHFDAFSCQSPFLNSRCLVCARNGYSTPPLNDRKCVSSYAVKYAHAGATEVAETLARARSEKTRDFYKRRKVRF